MPNALVPLASFTLSSAQATITFAGIPSNGFRDLRLVISGSMGTPSSPSWRANGDAGANYSGVGSYGSGSTAASMANSGVTQAGIGYWWTSPGTNSLFVATCDWLDYATTDKQKTSISRTSEASLNVDMTAGRWASTAAITSLTIVGYNGGGSFAAGSTFNLFGVIG